MPEGAIKRHGLIASDNGSEVPFIGAPLPIGARVAFDVGMDGRASNVRFVGSGKPNVRAWRSPDVERQRFFMRGGE